MLWTEKYRPNNLNDIVGQEHFTMDANHLGWKNVICLMYYCSVIPEMVKLRQESL